MLRRITDFLNRPIAEEFSFRVHLPLSLQAGVYVFLFVSLMNGSFRSVSALAITGLLSVGCVGAVLLTNVVIPKLLPAFYDEDRWTVGRHCTHTLFVLFVISCTNQLILAWLDSRGPSFGQMYLLVTLIGFFPIMLGVFVAEQRRLKRNLSHAQTMNEQLAQGPVSPAQQPPDKVIARPIGNVSKPVLLTSDSGKERLSLQPDQLLCVESVGNYVEVYWVDGGQAQKTTLRATLKDIADTLAGYPQFLRCHRAFLVNLNAVRRTEGNARGYQLTLAGLESRVPVSRSYLETFDARFRP